MRYLKRK